MLVVQVNGKLRARIEANPGLAESEAVALALRAPAVSKHLGGRSPHKQVYVPDKLLNLVV
ncbi:MAG: hypothetical protein JO043_09320 [Candidatus Eremiobacteraeota bacterium]|nr:hypothetical protein [Candidatus Eremiobacteraeota bacterium]